MSIFEDFKDSCLGCGRIECFLINVKSIYKRRNLEMTKRAGKPISMVRKGRSFIATAALMIVLLSGLMLLASCTASPDGGAPLPSDEETAGSSTDGQRLVQERCTSCHGLGQIVQAKKSEEKWRATVRHMVEKGANLNESEEETVVEYLSSNYSN